MITETLTSEHYMVKRRANEDRKCRQERLTKQRKYAQQQRAAQKNVQRNNLHNLKMQHKHTVPDNNHREERLIESQHYQKSIENLISEFHSIASSGPLYFVVAVINYGKHSVTLASGLLCFSETMHSKIE